MLLLAAACGASEETGEATPSLRVHVVGSSAAFAHDDGLSGQTPTDISSGVRSLRLFDDAGGVWTVLERASPGVSVSYSDAAPRPIARIDPASVRAGHYVKARMVQEDSRFTVNARFHDDSLVQPSLGALRIYRVMNDDVPGPQGTYPAGYFSWQFESKELSRKGEGVLPVPAYSTTAGAEALVEDGQWAVYFPLDVTIPAGAHGELRITANLFESFRWKDQTAPDDEAGAYDLSQSSAEPVLRFGGNRFDVTFTAD